MEARHGKGCDHKLGFSDSLFSFLVTVYVMCIKVYCAFYYCECKLDKPNNATCSGTQSDQCISPVEVQNSVVTQELQQ